MKANKDAGIQIKEIDKDFFHIEHTRIIRDSTGKYPETTKRVQIYSRKEWGELLFFIEGNNVVAGNGLGATNDDELRIVHDPVLYRKTENEAFMKQAKANEAQARREAAEKKAAEIAEAKRKADEAKRKADEKKAAAKLAAAKKKAEAEKKKTETAQKQPS